MTKMSTRARELKKKKKGLRGIKKPNKPEVRKRVERRCKSWE